MMPRTEKTAAEVAAELNAHERECVLRYDAILRRLDDGSKRFDKLDRWLMGLYATIIGLSLAAIFGPI
jgi:hypothetical protein